MIITKLQGGLGNQLFQWAATYSASKKLNCDYFFDLSFYNNSVDRPFMLSNFDLKIEQFRGHQVFLKILNDDFKYSPIKDNCFLNGYWQSEKYFVDHKDDILNIILSKNTEDNTKRYISKYPCLLENTTSLHIRRGDYSKLEDTHPIQSLGYYHSALNILSPKNILIFSDDIAWCRSNLNFQNCVFVDGEDAISSLYLMSLCKSNIIANSTFSWWGAWLNKNKRVIAPKKWFGINGPADWKDIYCEDWVVI